MNNTKRVKYERETGIERASHFGQIKIGRQILSYLSNV